MCVFRLFSPFVLFLCVSPPEVVDMELGDVQSVPLGAAPSVAEADALWAAIGATCHGAASPPPLV